MDMSLLTPSCSDEFTFVLMFKVYYFQSNNKALNKCWNES